MKKNVKKLFTIFFILYQKITLVSSLENSPYFIFFPKDDRATIIYNFLLLRPCTLLVLQTSQNRFGFFIRLVSSFWFWHRQYYLPWPYRIYCLQCQIYLIKFIRASRIYFASKKYQKVPESCLRNREHLKVLNDPNWLKISFSDPLGR